MAINIEVEAYWSQIEAMFKLMDDAETELKCFQALRNQEKLAASHRVNYALGRS